MAKQGPGELKFVRCRVLERAYLRVGIPGEDGGMRVAEASLGEDAIVDVLDVPEFHIERYRSAAHPKGWPEHLLEIVDPATPLNPDFAASQRRQFQSSHEAAAHH
ncbi:MAG: hypothetical protein AB7P16_28485 [Bradyrhizobium sp.]|uniref:hypothetical protein n=1 Tax=Bradyrhizobium sp. TaxID=376 RepID=UPI003D136212